MLSSSSFTDWFGRLRSANHAGGQTGSASRLWAVFFPCALPTALLNVTSSCFFPKHSHPTLPSGLPAARLKCTSTTLLGKNREQAGTCSRPLHPLSAFHLLFPSFFSSALRVHWIGTCSWVFQRVVSRMLRVFPENRSPRSAALSSRRPSDGSRPVSERRPGGRGRTQPCLPRETGRSPRPISCKPHKARPGGTLHAGPTTQHSRTDCPTGELRSCSSPSSSCDAAGWRNRPRPTTPVHRCPASVA